MRSPCLGRCESPHVEVAPENLSGLERAVGQRSALITGRDCDRPGRGGLGQSIGPSSVEAAVEAGHQNQVGAGYDRAHLEFGRGDAGGVAQDSAAGRPDADPRPEVVRFGNLADMNADPVSS